MVARYNGAYAKRQVGFEFCLGSGLRRQDADAEADLAMATNGTETHTHSHNRHTLQFVVTSYTFLHIRAAL